MAVLAVLAGWLGGTSTLQEMGGIFLHVFSLFTYYLLFALLSLSLFSKYNAFIY